MVPKVSVIVPIYNVERYLKKCVDSIINQSLKEIEIILVDDGSTDNSGKIADEYINKDERIKVIHKENGGQGSARNAGIEAATGEYIGFVDSDDWIDEDMYKMIYKKAICENLDIAICSRKIWDEKYTLGAIIEVRNELIKDLQKDLPGYYVDYLLYTNTVSACNKIYKSDLIRKWEVKFEDVKKVGSEDAFFNYCALLNTNRIGSISGVYYNGVERVGSTTRSYKAGAMERTASLLEATYHYSKLVNKSDKYNIIAPILLLFFQQWNYNFIKGYGGNNLKENLKIEHKKAEKNKYFRQAEKNFIFDKETEKYIVKMGFTNKGKLFMKAYMGLNLLGLYGLAARIRVSI